MTSSVLSPTAEQPPVESMKAAAPPRKRRRRTHAAGATDDCFACRKRSIKCDRKRPYCSQCIDIGKECSGYKTTLTWGVGVASRGKLRGLSCPVANKNADGTDVSAQELEARRRRKSSVSKVKVEAAAESNRISPPTSQLPIGGQLPLPAQAHAQTYPPPSLPIPIPPAQSGWQMPPSPGFQEHLQARQSENGRHMSFSNPRLERLQTSLAPPFDHGFPHSATSVGSYAETEYYSPKEYPHTPGSMTFSDQYQQMLPPMSYIDQPMSATTNDSIASESVDHYPAPMGSSLDHTASGDGFPNHSTDGYRDDAVAVHGTMNPSQAEFDSFNNMMFDSTFEDDMIEDDNKSLAIVDTRFSSPFFHLSPRLQSLLDYYDHHVCPFLVAFDSPQNPYRMHVLQLATHNEGLQNALGALATNNMRMRKKEARRSGFVSEITDAFGDSSLQDVNEPSAEETCYKQMSIDQLNMQLTDPRAAQDDSVLATLLILCLFHVCDSGFSKFKTQLAGVQKLLSLRTPNAQSGFTGWVEMFFTWFDVMTSTVNDRELQIQGESLNMLDFSANLGALEQFSGCDGRLFKLIARLGRLNLLAQGRPVRSQAGLVTPRPKTTSKPSNHRPLRRRKPSAKLRANKSLLPEDYENMDGNGWGTPIISSDEDADGSADESLPPNAPAFDERREFWAEWHDIRNRLQEWQMDTNNIPSPSPSTTDPTRLGPEQRDLMHISESFRHSALLYIERLANPLVPSSAPTFQLHVSQALFHITALDVTSCVNKFLLWPLFITGTECIDEGHRSVIRTRCIEIQKESGFFNNISGLEVLERVWRDGNVSAGSEEAEVKARRRDSTAGSRGGAYGQAFRWRKAMDRVDGEYIVI